MSVIVRAIGGDGDLGCVHIFGLPEPASVGLDQDERFCSAPDAGEVVVFHVASREAGGVWYCDSCGVVAAAGE